MPLIKHEIEWEHTVKAEKLAYRDLHGCNDIKHIESFQVARILHNDDGRKLLREL